VPVGADFSQLAFVGGLLTGACLMVISISALVVALRSGDPNASNISLLVFLALLAVAGAITGLNIGSFALFYVLVPLVFVVTTLASPELRRANSEWLRQGIADQATIRLSLLTVLVVSGLIGGWLLLLHPDLGHQPLLESHKFSVGELMVGGVAVALLNAAVEEAIFRGVLMQALDAAIGATSLSVLIQAICFGAFHLNGTERGWLGVVGATIFGFLLGTIRRRSRGMLPGYATHIAVDIVVFAIGIMQTR
jgi:membrane protease YdiL (CAAX protease family)